MASTFTTKSGPASDLATKRYYTFGYRAFPVVTVPEPYNVVLHLQGSPLPDPLQKHSVVEDVKQATHYLKSNPLPYHHFIGLSDDQINQPQYLGVNEKIVWG